MKCEKILSILLTIFLTLHLNHCSGTRSNNLGSFGGKLSPCPKTPNCVSTFSNDTIHTMPPIPYGEMATTHAKTKLLTIIKNIKRTKIITESDRYLHVEFTSKIWRFVDDVEFLFDEEHKLIHFRSASRLGQSDLGVNRKRMEHIRMEFSGI